MVSTENRQFLVPESRQEYKDWLSKTNSTGNAITPDTVSDERVKKFLIDSVDGDDILRKILMLNFVSNHLIDKNLADIYILKRMVK